MIVDVCIVRDEEKKEREGRELSTRGKPVKAATDGLQHKNQGLDLAEHHGLLATPHLG